MMRAALTRELPQPQQEWIAQVYALLIRPSRLVIIGFLCLYLVYFLASEENVLDSSADLSVIEATPVLDTPVGNVTTSPFALLSTKAPVASTPVAPPLPSIVAHMTSSPSNLAALPTSVPSSSPSAFETIIPTVSNSSSGLDVRSSIVNASWPQNVSSPWIRSNRSGLVIFTYAAQDIGDLEMFTISSWLAIYGSASRVLVFMTNHSYSSSAVRRSSPEWIRRGLNVHEASGRLAFPILDQDDTFPLVRNLWTLALQQTDSAQWLCYVEPNVVLQPERMTALMTGDHMYSNWAFVGGKFDCPLSKFRPVGPRTFNRFDILYFHHVLNCDFAGGAMSQPGYLLFLRDMFDFKLVSEMPLFKLGSNDILWQIWISNAIKSHVVDGTPVAPAIQIARPIGPAPRVLSNRTRAERAVQVSNALLACSELRRSIHSDLARFDLARVYQDARRICFPALNSFNSQMCPSFNESTLLIVPGLNSTAYGAVQFIGDYLISREDLRFDNAGNLTRFERHFANEFCHQTDVNVTRLLPRYDNSFKQKWYKRQDFHACYVNCWWGGVGSRTFGFALLYNLSLALGFQAHVQEGANDYDHFNFNIVDHFAGVYENSTLFYPKRCDWVTRAYEVPVFRKSTDELRSYYHYPFWDTIMSGLFERVYSRTLRQKAGVILRELQKMHARKALIPVYVRLEDQMGGRQDRRFSRRLKVDDFLLMMRYFEDNLLDKEKEDSAHFLFFGDKGINFFRNMTNVTILEEFVQERLGPKKLRESQFTAMDIASRLSRRIGIQYSNNIYMQMAFHKINNNTENISFGDVFSMRIYDYFFNITKDLEMTSVFNPRAWYFRESPYFHSVNPLMYTNLVQSFGEVVFNSTLVRDKWKNLESCEKDYLLSEVG